MNQPDQSSENTGNVTASGGDRALRQRTQHFVAGWRDALGKSWEPERASALHEDLERLTAQAEEQNAVEIVEPALELTVYLCSFVDAAASPNPSQKQELDQLVERLATASGDTPARKAAGKAATSAEHPTRKHAFYLRPDDRDLPGLAARLGQQGFVVHPFDERDRLLLALEEVSPDVVLIDEALVAEVHIVSETVERQRQAHKDPSLCLVLAEHNDITRVLFAQRAGADAVIRERDPIGIVMRIDELSAQRRALGYRVLIIEDDRAQAKFCESILRHRGMITSVCENPELVQTAIDEFKPDLVLLDLYLPGSNGIEIAQRIREREGLAFLPVVFLSGEHDLDLRFDAMRVGADDFITKPVKPRHLLTAVESRIKRARQLSSGQGSSVRIERRGILTGRDVFGSELLRAAREEQDRCPALALIAVDDVDDVQRSVGFVAGTLLSQQIAAALAADLSSARTLCAWGDLKFLALMHSDDELALRQQLESLRTRLDARAWLSDEAPTRLHFTIAATRLIADMQNIDSILERVRTQSRTAQQAGGARCELDLRAPNTAADENPQQRLVRAILRAPSMRDSAQFGFQPLVPLAGKLMNQYEARMALKPPRSSQALLLQRDEYLPIARELGMLAHADRYLVRGVLDQVRDKRGADLRLFAPISVTTLLDPAFAPWLSAELGSHDLAGNVLALEFEAGEIKSELARMRSALESLQRIGTRLVLIARPDNEADLPKLLNIEDFAAIKLMRGEDAKAEKAWDVWRNPTATAISLGKIVIASGVSDMGDLGVLLRMGMHYAQGELLSGWLAECNFDFSDAVL